MTDRNIYPVSIVYDLTVKFPKKDDAREVFSKFMEQLRGNRDLAECRVGIFYGGGKKVRVVEYEDSSTHLNVYRAGGSYILKTVKDGEPERRPW